MNLAQTPAPEALDRSAAPKTAAVPRVTKRSQRDDRPPTALLCRACRSVVSDERQRIEVHGRHRHSRVNPHGLSFVFGCFREAPGAAGIGAAVAEHTWFKGYTWRIACCSRCGEHLGWLYEGSEVFYGLILARLIGE